MDSPLWCELRSHFGNAGLGSDDCEDVEDPDNLGWVVPKLLERWQSAVGSYAEEYAYDALFEAYLHQRTIVDVAYAVVPHLAEVLARLPPDRRLEIINDIAMVEAVRLTPREEVDAVVKDMKRRLPADLADAFIESTRAHHPLLPERLASPYLAGIRQAQVAARDLIGAIRDEEDFRCLLVALCQLNGQRQIAEVLDKLDRDHAMELIQDYLSRRMPSARDWRRHVAHLRSQGWQLADIELGVALLREEGADGDSLIYDHWRASLEALRELEPQHAPPGWFERTKLGRDSGELAVRALRSIAWSAQRVPVRTMLTTVGEGVEQ